MKLNHLLLSVLLTLIIIFPAIIYFYSFPGPLSVRSADWANFSTYLGVFVAFGNLLALMYFSSRVYKYNKAIDRPVLSFELLSKQQKYQIVNVGRGAAINVRCKIQYYQADGWKNHVIYYSLAPLEKKVIEIANPNALLASYTDVNGVPYSSFMIDDTNFVYSPDKRPPENHKQYFSSQGPPASWPEEGLVVA